MRGLGLLVAVLVGVGALGACDDRRAGRDEDFDPGPPDAGPLLCDDALTLAPEGPLDFGRLPAGATAERVVTLTNEGVCPVTLDEATFVGSDAFSLVDPAALANPDGDDKPGLSPGASATVAIRFTSAGVAAQAGLRLHTSAAHTPLLVVPLRANTGRCLRATPEVVEFPRVPVFERERRELTLHSCGDRPVNVEGLAFENPAGVFWHGVEVPMHLPPGETVTVPVEFAPVEGGDYAGALVFESDDPERPELPVPLRAEGRANRCPTPAVVETDLFTEPLGVVSLDGGPSTDPEGEVVAWRWTLIEAPMGSTTRPVETFFDPDRPQAGGAPDDPETPEVLLWADLAGRYVLELQVTDRYGLVSPGPECPLEATRVVVIAEPEDDLHIQLVWHTPADPDETDDAGTDIDLHLLHPGSTWDNRRQVCFYGDQNPDWGPPGDAGDPSLDIDDVTGAGPENINLDDPENTSGFDRPYRIGVQYYSDNGWGMSTATVRIYLSGLLEAEFSRDLLQTGAFWEVAGVVWTPQRHGVDPIDRLDP